MRRLDLPRGPHILAGAALIAMLLAACNRAEPSAAGVTAAPTNGGTGGAAPAAPAATATDAPPQEIVMCAGPRPANLYTGGGPAAQAVLRLAQAAPVVFGDDYQADGSDLLVELPNTEDGTLRRNDDGTISVTLAYRDDLVWSDGEPFDAEDAVYGLNLNAPGGLLPAAEVLDAARVDEHTVEVTLAEGAEYPYVPLQPPLPAHVLHERLDFEAPEDSALLGPALGPYALAADEGSALRFEANPNHPAAGSLVQQVTVRFYDDPAQIPAGVQSGACDVVLDDALAAGTGVEAVLYAPPGQVAEQVILNTFSADTGRPALFADVRTRQAVARALNRAELAQSLWGDLSPVMDSWLPANHWAYPGAENVAQYVADPEAAAALLDQAGWRDDDGDGTREYRGPGGAYTCGRGEWGIPPGTPLAPVLVIPADDPLREQIAQRIVADLGQVGIRVEIQAVPPAALYSADGPLVRRDFDMALLASITRPDPGGVSRWIGAEMFLQPLTRQPVHRWELEDRWLQTEQMIERLAYTNIPGPGNLYQGQNFAGWCHEEGNRALVSGALLGFTVEERQPFYAQHLAIFAEELPAVPLFARPRIAAARDGVCGLQPGPVEPVTWNIAQWTYSAEGCGE